MELLLKVEDLFFQRGYFLSTRIRISDHLRILKALAIQLFSEIDSIVHKFVIGIIILVILAEPGSTRAGTEIPSPRSGSHHLAAISAAIATTLPLL